MATSFCRRSDSSRLRAACIAPISRRVFADDSYEQVFQRCRRMRDLRVCGAEFCKEALDLTQLRCVQSLCADMGDVLDLEQIADGADRLHLSFEQDRDPVAYVLHVGQQVRAEQDGL